MEDLWSDQPSDKARRFVEELAALCEKHGVVLSVEGYDALQVWDRKPEDGGPISAPCIQDRTGGRTATPNYSHPGYDR